MHKIYLDWEDTMFVAEKLAEYRKKKNLRYIDLALILDISEQGAINLESGKMKLTRENLKYIKRQLKKYSETK